MEKIDKNGADLTKTSQLENQILQLQVLNPQPKVSTRPNFSHLRINVLDSTANGVVSLFIIIADKIQKYIESNS